MQWARDVLTAPSHSPQALAWGLTLRYTPENHLNGFQNLGLTYERIILTCPLTLSHVSGHT